MTTPPDRPGSPHEPTDIGEFQRDSSAVAQSLNNLSSVFLELGRFAEAEGAILRAAAIWWKNLGPDHPRNGIAQLALADLYLRRGEAARAEPLLRNAVPLFERTLPAGHPRLALALAIPDQALGPDDPLTVETRQLCGQRP